MKKHISILLGIILLFSGCSSGSMTVSTYDGATGKGETKQYSKYYDAGDWVINGKLGISVVVDHEKRNIPVLYGIQQSMGALGPSDLQATGKVTIYFWNLSDSNYSLGISKVVSRNHVIDPKIPVFAVQPKSRPGTEVGEIPIANYGLEIPIVVNYEIDGKADSISLKLSRSTFDDLERYFGPKGRPPYPWYKKEENGANQ